MTMSTGAVLQEQKTRFRAERGAPGFRDKQFFDGGMQVAEWWVPIHELALETGYNICRP